MRNLLFAFLLSQTIPQNSGFVTGVVHNASGTATAGVRVYAVAARDGTPGSAAAMEGLISTDASGRYRMQLPAGRYYIASGSVSSPTYYPGTTDITKASALTVSAGSTIDAIDFGSFVPVAPANSLFSTLAPNSGEVLGILRYPDGTPAAGIPVSLEASGPSTNPLFRIVSRGITTDSAGRYHISLVPPGTYYVAAGFQDSPSLYPGTSDMSAAKSVTVVANSKADNIDFTVPRAPATTVVAGRVTAADGSPLTGATVSLRSQSAPNPAFAVFGLPARNPLVPVLTKSDGAFEFRDVQPGPYVLAADFTGLPPKTQQLQLSEKRFDMEIRLPLATLSGKILSEDGGLFPDFRLLNWVVLEMASRTQAGLNSRSTLSLQDGGEFHYPVPTGEFRLRFRTLPDEFEIRSAVADGVDLLSNSLRIDKKPVSVEIRIGKRTVSSEHLAKVSGTVSDATTGQPTDAARLNLCCLTSGLAEQLSTAIRPDGAFEFTAVSAGKYSVSLESKIGQPAVFVADFTPIEVVNVDVSGIRVHSTAQTNRLFAAVYSDSPTPLPDTVRPTIRFVSKSGIVRVVAERSSTGIYSAYLPAGSYDVEVSDLPPGFEVKSITGSAEVSVRTAGAGAGTRSQIVVNVGRVR